MAEVQDRRKKVPNWVRNLKENKQGVSLSRKLNARKRQLSIRCFKRQGADLPTETKSITRNEGRTELRVMEGV